MGMIQPTEMTNHSPRQSFENLFANDIFTLLLLATQRRARNHKFSGALKKIALTEQ